VIETQSYADFSRVLHDTVNPLRIPVNGTIEVTNRCPLECAHCYNNLPMSDAGARRRELTLDEHRRLLDELADLGCLWILFSGGEIFARADFLDIYRYAKSKASPTSWRSCRPSTSRSRSTAVPRPRTSR
jgi:MoaA/NifB/PqqE/SkfB family radical SAM enzyme